MIHEGGSQSVYPVGTVTDRINTIAQNLDPAVSVLISGHSHTVVDTRVGHALVIQASSFTRAYDDVHLLLDRQSRTIAATWASVQPVWENTVPLSTDPLAPAITPNPAVQTIVDAAVTATNPVTQQVINTAAADVPSQRDGGQTAAGESPAGDLIADSQRVYAHTQLAFVNTGSVRAGLQAGEVTYGDLFTMQPFQDDYVDTFSLTGAQVWALLGQQLAAGTGGIMQISGLHFTYTGSQGSGTITGVWLGAAGDNSTPIPNDTSHQLHQYGELVHDRWRRRLHGPGRRREHRADRRRRTRAPGVLRRHADQPVHLHHRWPDRDRLAARTGPRPDHTAWSRPGIRFTSCRAAELPDLLASSRMPAPVSGYRRGRD